jgi:hypothetical protein
MRRAEMTSRAGTDARNLTFPHACAIMVNPLLIAVMNRLSPLIVRRAGRWAAALPCEQAEPFAGTDAARWFDDLRLFATGWIAGLIVFGTFLS